MPTEIQWTDEVWNCLRGCSRVSAGCGDSTGGGCYAERQAYRFSGEGMPYEGLVRMTTKGPRWTGRVILVEDKLDEPLHWKKPRRVFVNSMSDLFHESVSDEWLDRIFAVMAQAPQHTFQVLTKRPERMRDYMNQYVNGKRKIGGALGERDSIGARLVVAQYGFGVDISTTDRHEPLYSPPRHVWLGVSVEDQKTADERIPLLLETPAAVRWISAEPLLGPIKIENYLYTRFEMGGARHMYNQLDWVVVGAESGPKARTFEMSWARDLIRQCKAAGVPLFVKQLGKNPFDEMIGVFGDGADTWNFKHPKGGDIDEWPKELQVREFPKAA